MEDGGGKPTSAGAARAGLEVARDRKRETEQKIAHEELKSVLQQNAALRMERAALREQLSEIERSVGWLLTRRVSQARARLLPEGTIRGRCWNLSSRFTKTALSVGITAALGKVFVKVIRKLQRRLGEHGGSASAFLSRVYPRNLPVDQFRALPWRFLGTDPRGSSQQSGYFKVLLVSHSACRTGAPLLLIRVAEELSRLPDVECWIVLKQGGELADAFARVAPTLECEKLVAQGVDRDQLPRLVASSFHEYSSRGMAVCNTSAVSDFHAALAERNVAVLSWIHELPTFIASLGGHETMEQIKAASRKIVVPAEAVRGELLAQLRHRAGASPHGLLRTGSEDARTRPRGDASSRA